MTQAEYLKKREAYMLSDAPKEVKDKAIAELDAKFGVTKAAKQAMENFYDSMPEYDNIGD